MKMKRFEVGDKVQYIGSLQFDDVTRSFAYIPNKIYYIICRDAHDKRWPYAIGRYIGDECYIWVHREEIKRIQIDVSVEAWAELLGVEE
jgi:hypothetical protein